MSIHLVFSTLTKNAPYWLLAADKECSMLWTGVHFLLGARQARGHKLRRLVYVPRWIEPEPQVPHSSRRYHVVGAELWGRWAEGDVSNILNMGFFYCCSS